MYKPLTDRGKINALARFCALIYFASYVSRINLGAILVEVTNSGFADKRVAALALTASSITYGVGQVISGYMGDRFKPQNVILTGFFITAAMNIGVAFLQNSTYLVMLWAINGLAQAFIWPPLVAILANHLNQEDYKKACVKVSWGSCFGTIVVYLFAPIMIKFFSFRSVFWISGIFAIAMAATCKSIFEKRLLVNDSVETTVNSEGTIDPEITEKPKLQTSAVIILLFILFAIVLQGALRDGVTNWMPSYISDVFHLDSSISILSGVILPIFSMVSLQITSYIYRHFIKNEMMCAAVIFLFSTFSTLLLAIIGNKNIALSILLLAILVGTMHGVNLILICMVPPYFAKYGKISLVSGIINSCTYVGSAISTYGIAVYTDAYGWNSTVFLWSAIALTGALICMLLIKSWILFRQEREHINLEK